MNRRKLEPMGPEVLLVLGLLSLLLLLGLLAPGASAQEKAPQIPMDPGPVVPESALSPGYTETHGSPSDVDPQSKLHWVAAEKVKVATPSWWLLSFASVAANVADVELTQRCIRAHTCREGNPVMGQSRAQQYGVSLPLSALAIWKSYKWKKEDAQAKAAGLVAGGSGASRPDFPWWTVHMVNIGMHGIAFGVNLTIPTRKR